MGNRTLVRVGIDDTDSERGMCTTYLAYRIVADLHAHGDRLADYPRLVRLNPNVPWRTRGNGAVGLDVLSADARATRARIESAVRRRADTQNGANPGVAFAGADHMPELASIARDALWRLVRRADARALASSDLLECASMGNGQGLVGALAAIGYEFGDSTVELLAYRDERRVGSPRKLSPESVRAMHERTFPETFNSYDEVRRRALIAPRGPDPVLYGVRGEDPASLVRASRMLRGEAPRGHMIFRTNQGTGDHLSHELDARALRAYESGYVSGELAEPPESIGGGHVRLALDARGARVDCFVYRPTGMGALARSLARGDEVTVAGAVRRASARHGRSLSAELLRVGRLARVTRTANAMCRTCSKRMKSKGVGQGYKCARCGRTASARETVEVARRIRAGVHVPLPSAQRHLARPAHRYGRINRPAPMSSAAWLAA